MLCIVAPEVDTADGTLQLLYDGWVVCVCKWHVVGVRFLVCGARSMHGEWQIWMGINTDQFVLELVVSQTLHSSAVCLPLERDCVV